MPCHIVFVSTDMKIVYELAVDGLVCWHIWVESFTDFRGSEVGGESHAAEEVFQMRSGIPREQRPAEVIAEQRAEAERRATAARAKLAEASLDAARTADEGGERARQAAPAQQPRLAAAGTMDSENPDASHVTDLESTIPATEPIATTGFEISGGSAAATFPVGLIAPGSQQPTPPRPVQQSEAA